MTKSGLFACAVVLIAVVRAAAEAPVSDGFVLVEGGPFKHAKSNFHGRNITIASFYIGKYEVTQKEWVQVMGSNPSRFQGDDLPVDTVSWYDCVEYCNRRSEQEGLQPCYTIDRAMTDPANQSEVDDVKWTVTINPQANGYRLPTEAEWEYAASGGQLSQNHTYSGGNDVNAVGWFWQNAGDEYLQGLWSWPAVERNKNRTHPVGSKQPNELGIYDMSGNVREWCWDWYEDQSTPPGLGRVWKGGGWMGGDFCCEPSFRTGFEANGKGADQGFRVCRGK